jgi:uncharacterized membrane protein
MKTKFGWSQFWNQTPRLAKSLGYGLLYTGAGTSIASIVNGYPIWFTITMICCAVGGKTLTSFFGYVPMNEDGEGK